MISTNIYYSHEILSPTQAKRSVQYKHSIQPEAVDLDFLLHLVLLKSVSVMTLDSFSVYTHQLKYLSFIMS